MYFCRCQDLVQEVRRYQVGLTSVQGDWAPSEGRAEEIERVMVLNDVMIMISRNKINLCVQRMRMLCDFCADKCVS